MGNSLDADIPRLLVNRIWITALRQVIFRQYYLRNLARRRQDLRDQRIGIKRDRPRQLVKLRGCQQLAAGLWRRSRVLRADPDSGANEESKSDGDDDDT